MSDLAGTVLGEYRLERLIGTGASGQVYRASQIQTNAAVAVKVIDRRFTSDANFKLRFVEHAQLVSGLAHPHLVTIHHFGEHDGNAFIVMELLAGTSFESLRSVPIVKSWDPALWGMVNLVREAAEGIAAVHERGVVHGDIKRSNLVLTSADRSVAHVKVTDVGLRRLLTPTPGFDADGFKKTVRRDLRALGYVLYEATTGRLVTPVEGAAPANVASPGQSVAGYPPALDLVVSRCLDAARRDQFATAGELRDALQTLCAAEAGTLRPSGNLAVVGPAPVVTLPPRREMQIVRSARPPHAPPPSMHSGSVPMVHVLDGAGVPVDRQHVRGAGLTIGTSADSDLVVESPDVSPTHARIDWDGQRVTVTDLGSATNSLLEGHLLLPQVAQEWPHDQWLQVGPYWVWLEQPPGPKPLDVGIEVLLDQTARVMEITPGKASVCRLTLVNNTVRVDRVTLAVAGIPAEWLEGADRETRLQPYERKEVVLAIHVPRTPAGRAGKYNVTISVNSTANPDGNHGSAEAHWAVQEFWAAEMSIAPTKTSGFRRATFSVLLHHDGNSPTTYSLAGADENKYLTCAFLGDWYSERARPQVQVDPGSTTVIKVAVGAPRLWFGSSAAHGFTIEAAPITRQERVKVEGQFTQRPIFPMWMIAVAPLVLIAFLYLGMQYGKPQVRTVYLEPLTPNAGQDVTVFWDAPRATRIRISVNDAFIRPDPETKEAQHTFAGGFTQATRIKVLGSNWFGEAVQEVTVAPKPPGAAPLAVIDNFTVNPLTIATNQEVRIRWHTTGATRVELSPIGTVDPSGMTTHSPAGNLTYTLTAFNKDNQPVSKSIMVTVRDAPPPPIQLSFSTDAQRDSHGVIAVDVGESVNFTWQATNAQSVRIDAVTPVMLQGTSGQRLAMIKGEGRYTFTLIATDAKGAEFRSKPVIVTAECSNTRFFKLKFGCEKQPQVQW
jgi:serine/threonine protein kinase